MDLDTLESQVYSRIKNKMPSSIKTKYKDLNFTTNNISLSDAKFPCVYIHMIESPEYGEDMEGTEINAVFASFVIEIFDNESQANTNTISKEVQKIMKQMRFKAIGVPYNDNSNSTYRKVSKYRRTIANNDVL
jgi:hypothetical protein